MVIVVESRQIWRGKDRGNCLLIKGRLLAACSRCKEQLAVLRGRIYTLHKPEHELEMPSRLWFQTSMLTFTVIEAVISNQYMQVEAWKGE